MADTLTLPAPRTPDPQDAPPLRWGILAPGRIAAKFVETVQANTTQQVVATGSRSAERSAEFAGRFGIARAHGSYEDLVGDDDVDVVYVASPHSGHHAQALLAIQAGKHVLVEKAFTRNATEAQEVVDAARAAGVLVMEAMWTRYLPHIDVVRQLLDDGTLGEVRTVIADHGQRIAEDPTSRLFDPELAGGALLDLGIYPLSFASFVLGTPIAITARGQRAFTGVDGQVSVVLDHGDEVQALISTTLFARTPTTATISGTQARIELAGDFYAPTSVTLIDRDGARGRWDDNPLQRHAGLCFQAAELARLVERGETESSLLGLDETVQVLQTCDEIRRQIGVSLPGE